MVRYFKRNLITDYWKPNVGTTVQRGFTELSAKDIQIGGDHYKKKGIQPVEFIVSNNLGFCEGSAIKYIFRHELKGGKLDLEKAIHYIELLIEEKYGPK